MAESMTCKSASDISRRYTAFQGSTGDQLLA